MKIQPRNRNWAHITEKKIKKYSPQTGQNNASRQKGNEMGELQIPERPEKLMGYQKKQVELLMDYAVYAPPPSLEAHTLALVLKERRGESYYSPVEPQLF